MTGSATLPSAGDEPQRIGRYLLFESMASGGMAQVHLGRLVGPVGFSRIVAIKRLHPHLAVEADFVSMFLDEARLAARVRHPNVVPILDVVSQPTELFIVMEYVAGESLSALSKAETAAGQRVPADIVSAVLLGALAGLHAAHEATSETGSPLHIVHRDVSPQNIMVGADGVPRVLDFGIAYAAERLQMTRTGQVKGKPEYMSPEQLMGGEVDRRTDVYAAGVVAWELFSGRRLFRGKSDAHTFQLVSEGAKQPPGAHARGVPRAVDKAVMKALAVDPAHRFPTARDFAAALEGAMVPASQRAVADWVERTAGPGLAARARRVARIEAGDTSVPSSRPPLTSSPDAATAAATEHESPDAGPLPRAEVSLVTGDMSALRSTGGEPPRRVWLALAGSLLGAVLFCAVILVLLVARGNGASAPAVVESPVTAVAPVVSETSAIVAAPAPQSSADAAPSASTPASATPEPKPTASAPVIAKKLPRAKPGMKAPDPCDPPFTYTETSSGRVKVPKPQCF